VALWRPGGNPAWYPGSVAVATDPVADLAPLIGWFRDALAAERTVPLTLHDRDRIDADGAPSWSAAFWQWLTASAAELTYEEAREPCPHAATLGDPVTCRLCGGSGYTTAGRWRPRYPLAFAIRGLAKGRGGERHLAVLARFLRAGCDPARAGIDPAALGRALRSVRWRYWGAGGTAPTADNSDRINRPSAHHHGRADDRGVQRRRRRSCQACALTN
jgi:hypothetical protein